MADDPQRYVLHFDGRIERDPYQMRTIEDLLLEADGWSTAPFNVKHDPALDVHYWNPTGFFGTPGL